MRFSMLTLAMAFLALAIFSTGCNYDTDNGGGNATQTGNGDHDHDHEHDHDDDHKAHAAHGPNGGHMFEIDSEQYVAEWCKFKDNDVIKMHLYDKATKEPALVKVDSFVVRPMAGKDDLSFELEADKADADGKASTYMLDDQDLSIAIPLGVNIEIKMGDKMIKGKIDAHEPLDH